MPEAIGELLMRRGACSREALAQAWELKVLFGDRLGTNLLAQGLISERDLALALGEQHGVHAAHRELLRINPHVLGLVDRRIVEYHSVIPHHRSGNTLFLLMVDPHNLAAISEVRSTTGLNVAPVVVCEARMWQLLQAHFHINKSMRPVSPDKDPLADVARAHAATPPPTTATVAQSPELTSESEFFALYVRPNEAESDLPPEAAMEHAEDLEELHPLLEDDEDDDAVDATLPDARSGSSFAAPPSGVASLYDEDAITAASMEGPSLEPRPSPAPPLVVDTPLDFAAAERALVGVHDRNEIARVVLRYALSRCARASLLTVHPAGYAGWVGVGPDMGTDVVRQFQVRATEQSVFSFVVNSRAHYIGPLQKYKAHGPWVKMTGKQLPRSIAVFPVLVRGRVVNLLYLDNGHEEHVISDVGELLILAQHIARSYEALLAGAGSAFGLPAGNA